MANANFFSPDGGITRYPLEDTEGRTTYEEEIHGINKAVPNSNRVTLTGITYTKTSDTITANGTASGSNSFCYWSENLPWSDKPMILKGCPAGGSSDTYQLICATSDDGSTVYVSDTGNGATVPANTTGSSLTLRIYVRIKDGATVSNLAIKPMLYDAIYGADFAYRPYNQQSIQHQINDITGVTGVRNLLENTAITQTINGVTFTVNDDGSVTANGTATAQCWFPVRDYLQNPLHLDAGSYFVNGCRGGSSSKYFIRVTNGAPALVSSYDGETAFNLSSSSDSIGVYIVIGSNQTASNLVFKPMIRLASDPDDTYQPYAMTNRGLTEKVFEKRTLTSADDLNNITETGIYKISTAPVNSPESVAYATLIVCKYDANDINQMIYRGGSSSGNIYIRSKGGSPSAWLPWYKFTGTVVS